MKKTKKHNNVLTLIILLVLIFVLALVLNNKFFLRTKANSVQPSLSDIILFDQSKSFEPLDKNAISYVVMLFNRNKAVDEYGFIDQTKLSSSRKCTGAIIDKNWIITAAHCVANVDSKGNIIKDQNIAVLIGYYDLKKQRFDYSKVRFPTVYDLYPNHGFKINTILDKGIMSINDLALIRVSDLPYYPIVLAQKIDFSKPASAIGWGAIGIDNKGNLIFSDTIKEISLTIQKPQIITLAFNTFLGTTFSDKVIAAYVNDGYRIQPGDSGSPLIINDYLLRKSYLVGIDSSGIQFTDVTKYLKWIKDISGITPSR
ncbi:MAG: hypothetical protein US40_C0006G0051 [Candidatus Roizmanbacteria bacterium GW2011_GWC2_37_13]|uniref:Peptidase S1 domain-containing protein n=1 Tax=Candidatus Roizmanbacteria bacterium GW2011_GWC2_37_13 TaxID=1618486 RepID=A0A0G0INI1_9BACT|nr:MAG: hypothetical protein US40_C0006G0051 [Candidatus Roizmanbacteria bacterium GW2011_GWC2_37_13]